MYMDDSEALPARHTVGCCVDQRTMLGRLWEKTGASLITPHGASPNRYKGIQVYMRGMASALMT